MTSTRQNKENLEKNFKTSQSAGFSSFTPKSKFSFSKQERLKSSQAISEVFSKSKSVSAYPLLLFYKEVETQSSQPIVKAAFTVSKKKFRKAVDRNKVKRLMREAFRLNKHILYNNPLEKQLHLVFVYTGEKIESFHKIEQQMITLVKKILS